MGQGITYLWGFHCCRSSVSLYSSNPAPIKSAISWKVSWTSGSCAECIAHDDALYSHGWYPASTPQADDNPVNRWLLRPVRDHLSQNHPIYLTQATHKAGAIKQLVLTPVEADGGQTVPYLIVEEKDQGRQDDRECCQRAHGHYEEDYRVLGKARQRAIGGWGENTHHTQPEDHGSQAENTEEERCEYESARQRAGALAVRPKDNNIGFWSRCVKAIQFPGHSLRSVCRSVWKLCHFLLVPLSCKRASCFAIAWSSCVTADFSEGTKPLSL